MRQKIDLDFLCSDRYRLEQDLLLKSLKERFPNSASIYGSKFNPYPVKVERHLLARLSILQKTIIEAVEKIIKNYFNDRDLQSKLKLCDRSQTILKLASNIPYSVGTLRPDFLFDRHQTIRVCEINARFPLNGLIMSNFLADYFSQRSACFGGEIFGAIAVNFAGKKPLRIIKGVERGYDIHLMFDELKKTQSGIDIGFIKPDELSLKGDKLYAKDIACDRFILELHQHEILALPLPILRHLIEKTKYINDIRTILVAHDKRLLSILGDRELMAKYLNNKQLDLLAKHIIYTSNIDRQTKQNILDYPDKWVLKKYLSGKTEGMYLARELARKELNSILDKAADLYIAQHFIEQKSFPILSLKDNKLQIVSKHLVGLSMSFNRQFLGMGFFRGGTGDIINISTEDGEVVAIY